MNATPAQRMQLFDPVVQQRLRATMGYFSGACAGTGGVVYMLRNSFQATNPWLFVAGTFLGSLGCLYGLHTSDYHTQWAQKNLFYAGLVGCMSATLVPLI